MDWAGVIERNRSALAPIVATMFAMLGEVAVDLLPHTVHRAVLRILRPAESAVRRLIVIAARGLVAKPTARRSLPASPIVKKTVATRPAAFRLFDPRKRFTAQKPKRPEPRIHFFGHDPRVAALWARRPAPAPAPLPEGIVNGRGMMRRLEAVKAALDDLPRQARRLVRLRENRKSVPALRFRLPMRPGRPPGYRRKPLHEVDEILAECHALAHDALKPDTS